MKAIGDFRITFGLFFKASPGAHLFIWKLVFICMWMKTNFQMKGWAPGLALKKRPKVIQKWPIGDSKNKEIRYYFTLITINYYCKIVSSQKQWKHKQRQARSKDVNQQFGHYTFVQNPVMPIQSSLNLIPLMYWTYAGVSGNSIA